MNLNKIKGKLKENNLTYADISLTLGISRTAFNDKINGKRKFYVDEIKEMSKKLNLTDEEKINIFLLYEKEAVKAVFFFFGL